MFVRACEISTDTGPTGMWIFNLKFDDCIPAIFLSKTSNLSINVTSFSVTKDNSITGVSGL